MNVDWDRLAGQGGAYLVQRAAAALLYGQLTPLALRLVEEEVERLKFILDEEISRLEPAGDLTAAAIAALRMHYQARLDAAENVIAAARRMAVTAPTLPSPEGGGKEASAPTLNVPNARLTLKRRSRGPGPPAGGGGK